jgi:hypothetical protein
MKSDLEVLSTQSIGNNSDKPNRGNILLGGTILAAASAPAAGVPVQIAHGKAQTTPGGKRPTILIIWGEDVGIWNISAYHRGMMATDTPNIDRIAREGMLFMDHYAQASCTAGRAAL